MESRKGRLRSRTGGIVVRQHGCGGWQGGPHHRYDVCDMSLPALLGAVVVAACREQQHEEVGWQVSAGGQHIEGGWHAP